jgi:putative hydrolase of HD superfamily
VTEPELVAAAYALKGLARAGWVRVGVDAPESVAAHSWGVAFLALLRCPRELDRGRVLALALLHDLAEARVGDITPHDGVTAEEKHRREREAAEELLAEHGELLALWQEAEARATPEARFVKELDLADRRAQAELYAAQGFAVGELLGR